MIIPRLSSNGILVQLDLGIPLQYKGFLLSAETWHSDDKYGLFILQQVLVNDKWLRYAVLKPNFKSILYSASPPGWLRMLLNLGAAMQVQTPPKAKWNFRQVQYRIDYPTERMDELELKAGHQYEFLEIWYPKTKLGEYEVSFPILNALPAGPQSILPGNTDGIRELINNSYAPAAHPMFYDVTLETILLRLLSQTTSLPLIDASIFEMEAIHKAKLMLEGEIKNYPDLKKIAKEVELSEYKLKMLFQRVYHKTAFELFIQAKMEKAYYLVTSTDQSIKAIAIDTGFKWAMNFATAFRKHFGEAPETLRERLRRLTS